MDGYTLFIKPTEECNLDCTYCDLESKKEQMSPELAKEICAFVKKSDEEFTRILFTGGEPLLNYEVIDIFAKEFPEIDIKMITNGTILNEEIKRVFTSNPNDFSIILSMDGPKKFQDKNRSDSFDDVMENYSFFKNYIKAVNIVVTPKSIFHLHEIVEFIEKNIHHEYDILIQNGIDWEGKIDIEKFKKYFRKKCLGYPQLRKMLYLSEQGLCECGDHLLINNKGDIYPCMNFNNEINYLGNIYDGIDRNKRRPYKYAREKEFNSNYICLLKNRDENGSIFNETEIHKFFLPVFLDLLKEVDERE
jgi:sulfatase maturation enzyme AslB (radical SAM superfamily)